MVNHSSRVSRKLSGELTIIQNWEDRPPSGRPDLRLRLERPGLGAGSDVGFAGRSGELERSSSALTIRTPALEGAQVRDPRAAAAGRSGFGSVRYAPSRGGSPAG